MVILMTRAAPVLTHRTIAFIALAFKHNGTMSEFVITGRHFVIEWKV